MQVVQANLTIRSENLELKQSWLAAIPTGFFDYAAIIEDDVLLSRFVVTFSQRCILEALLQDRRLIGCSYYVNPYSDITNTWSPGVGKPEEYTAWQMPQSWGAMYSGRVWDRFLLFEKETEVR